MEGTTLVDAQRAEPSIVRKNNHEAAKKLITVSNPGEEKEHKETITKLDKHAVIHMVAFLSFAGGIYFLSSKKELAQGKIREKEYMEEKTVDVFKMLWLYKILRQDKLAMIGLWRAAGADVNEALFLHSKRGDLRAVKTLLAAGADKDRAASDGRTPLWIASYKGHSNVVQALLAAGADKNKANNNGETPLSVAQKNDHTAIADLLLVPGANKDMIASYVFFAMLSITAVTVVTCLYLPYLLLVLAPLLNGALKYVGASLAQKIKINTIDSNAQSPAVDNQQSLSLLVSAVLGGLLGLGVEAMLCFAGLPLAAMLAVPLVASVGGVLCIPMAAKLCGCDGQSDPYTQVSESENSCGVRAAQ